MSDIIDCSSRLLCGESTDTCLDGLETASDPNRIIPHLPDPNFTRVPEITEEMLAVMLQRENEYSPKQDYLSRLRSGELKINFRREASDWIWKAHTHFSFGPLSYNLSMNYLDRFLSLYDLPKDEAWAVQLLAVACLSIAVKLEETDFPPTLQLQVGNPKFIFQAKTIQRMELLVLSILNWHMSALTPCSFVVHFLSKLYDDNPIPTVTIDRSSHLILATIKALDFLRFKPSEVAAAVAISVAGEMQTVSIDKLMSSSSPSCCILVQKVRVLECLELIKNMSLMSKCGGGGGGGESPNAVLEVGTVGCFSHKSDDITNSSQSSPNNNKRKRD